MKLFQQQDDSGWPRRPKTAKLFRRMKHKRERAAAKQNPETPPTYNRYCGWALSFLALLLCSCITTGEPVQHLNVTAPVRTSVTRAAEASHEAQAASERSSVHIKEFKTDAQSFRSNAARIHSDAKEIIRILNHP